MLLHFVLIFSLAGVLLVVLATAFRVRTRTLVAPSTTGRHSEGSNSPSPVDSFPQQSVTDTYRVRPGMGSERWDPYAAGTSRVERVRQARREARQRSERNRAPAVSGGPSFYDLLGIPPSASPVEIERAFRRVVVANHPDRFHDDPAAREAAENRMRELNAAMAVLRDPERRASYDRSRGYLRW
jgi:hypothetical protein